MLWEAHTNKPQPTLARSPPFHRRAVLHTDSYSAAPHCAGQNDVCQHALMLQTTLKSFSPLLQHWTKTNFEISEAANKTDLSFSKPALILTPQEPEILSTQDCMSCISSTFLEAHPPVPPQTVPPTASNMRRGSGLKHSVFLKRK